MMAWIPRGFAMLLLALPFVTVFADDPDDAEIARLVKRLGSSNYRMRDAATKRLKEIGEPAINALRKAATSNDVEARRRAEAIVAVIENKLLGPELLLTGDPATLADHPYRRTMVLSVSVSADGMRVLTSSLDTLRLWDTDTGKRLSVFTGHTGWISGAAISLDGKRVLSGSMDRTVRLWDATTGKELRQMTTSQVVCVAFGPEGKAISGAHDRTMRLWDLNTGKQASVFTGHTGSFVSSVAYSDQAKLAATSSLDRSIRLWDLETGKEVRQLTGHTEVIPSVRFSPDGKRLVSASWDATLRIWDVESGKELKQIEAQSRALCAAFSPDGKRIVSGGEDAAARVWDAATGKELHKYEGHTAPVACVTFFPDGKRIASASHDGTARIWRAPR